MTARFSEIVGTPLLTGDAIPEDYAHDEELAGPPQKPALCRCRPNFEEAAQLLKAASENGVPVTARGSGCGLSGPHDQSRVAADLTGPDEQGPRGRHRQPSPSCSPGVALTDLDAATADWVAVHGLPGSFGLQRRRECGTNAGGMRSSTEGPP